MHFRHISAKIQPKNLKLFDLGGRIPSSLCLCSQFCIPDAEAALTQWHKTIVVGLPIMRIHLGEKFHLRLDNCSLLMFGKRSFPV